MKQPSFNFKDKFDREIAKQCAKSPSRETSSISSKRLSNYGSSFLYVHEEKVSSWEEKVRKVDFWGCVQGNRRIFSFNCPRWWWKHSSIPQKYVEKETTILSDCWKGYFNIEKLDSNYDHWTVNHSKYFKDPVTGVHTNTMREPGLMRREVCQSLALIKSC